MVASWYERIHVNLAKTLHFGDESWDLEGEDNMAILLGKLEEYDRSTEDWTQYVERMDHFFDANEIVDVGKKKCVFGSCGTDHVRTTSKLGISSQTW